MSLKEKIKKCLKDGEINGERHKGLREITPNQVIVEEHLEKSIHNFKAIDIFRKTGYSDWSASAAFYALYHLLLALIAKKGYESRNQSCTFALIEEMIETGDLNITKDDLKNIFDKDVTINLEQSRKILDVRESCQYSTRTSLNDEEFEELKKTVKELFDKLRKELER